MVLEIILTWEHENFGLNVTRKSEKYLPNLTDPRMVSSSNITLKVTEKIPSESYTLLYIYKRLIVTR